MFIESVLGLAGTYVKSAPTEAEAAAAKATIEHNIEAAKKKEAAQKEAGKPNQDDPYKPEPSDAPSAYLTTEERIQHPEYAQAPPPPAPLPAPVTPEQGQLHPVHPPEPLPAAVHVPPTHDPKHPATAPLHTKEPHQK
jgi:hypothetical protein